MTWYPASDPGSVPDPGTASRSVLVTGASRGIGAALAQAFLASGDRVAGLSRSGQAPQGVLGLSADVTDPDAVAEALQQAREAHGPVEVLVSAAGVSADALAARTDPRTWNRLLSTNLTGAFTTVQALLPDMQRARRGRIVLLSSVLAVRGGVGTSAYGASKAGLEGLTRSLARELAPRGITVNAVAPGLIETDMTVSLSPQARSEHLRAVPMRRAGTVEEVVGPVLFLASEQASYVTGTVLGVDGGMGMGR